MDKNKKIMIGSLTTLGVGIVTASTALGITLANKDKNDPNLLKGEALHSKRLDLANKVLTDLWSKGMKFEIIHVNQPKTYADLNDEPNSNQPIMESIDDKVTFTNDPTGKIQTSFDNFIVQLKSIDNKQELEENKTKVIEIDENLAQEDIDNIHQAKNQEIKGIWTTQVRSTKKPHTLLGEDTIEGSIKTTYNDALNEINTYKTNYQGTNVAEPRFRELLANLQTATRAYNAKIDEINLPILQVQQSEERTQIDSSSFNPALAETYLNKFQPNFLNTADTNFPFHGLNSTNYNTNDDVAKQAILDAITTYKTTPNYDNFLALDETIYKYGWYMGTLNRSEGSHWNAKSTTIGKGAFDSSTLTSLSLPNVTSIGRSAFNDSKLTSLSLPNVTTIGHKAFYPSTLTSLSLPKVTSIGWSAFNDSKLTSLSLPNVTSIGRDAFQSSTLTSLSLSNVTSIGEWAFMTSKLTSLNLPNLTDHDSWDKLTRNIQDGATIIVKDQATKNYLNSIKGTKTWTITIAPSATPSSIQSDPAPRPDPISKPINPTPTIDPLRNNFNLNLMDIYTII